MYYQIPCSCLWKLQPSIKITCFNRFIHSNHYDTLKLPRNCTSKDIKDSYIKLSKENHPDVNKNKSAHKEFLKIKEAYNVLSKPSSRRQYDMCIKYGSPQTRTPYQQHTHDPWKDPFFYANRDKTKDQYYEQKPYYGVNGINRLPNNMIAFFCVMLTVIIVGLQVFTIRHSITFKRDELQRRSNEAEATLKKVREAAEANGNQKQIELLKAWVSEHGK